MEFIAGVIPLIIEYAAAPIVRHISYPFNCETNVKKLEEKVHELKTARQSMQVEVNAEISSGNLIKDDVEKWLVEVDGVVKESEGIALDREKAEKKCFLGFCPNLKTRYQVSRKVEKKAKEKAEEIVNFKQEWKEFREHGISDPPPPPCAAVVSAADYMSLESRTLISKKIMNALAAPDVSTVGLHGVGGVGKTKLAREVRKQAMEEKLFDYAIELTVTEDVNYESIQGEIVDMLGLKLEDKTVKGKAHRLFERLKNKDNAKNEDKAKNEDMAKNDKKILIVFDGLWDKLDLEKIGIPSDKQRCRGCKILLTSRDIDVLKYGMNCQNNIQVCTLDKDEAWGLFQKMADNSFENDDRQPTAKEVAEMCAGMPLAIVTVASTLRDKRLPEWEDALQRLKNPCFEDLLEFQTKIYKPIKLSYDFLKTNELKSTFLLCSQMGYRATTKDLLKYGIGRNLFRNVSKLKEAQDRVFSLVQKLKAVCLLLEGETNEELVMHNVVREVGRWIAASREHNVLVVNDENQMKQLVDYEDKLKTYSEIWLSSNIDELPEEIQCPNLALFHVDSKNPTLKIPDKLFTEMRLLTTLSFSGLSFPSLPSSFHSLENLKTLCIHESPELGDVSMVGKLRRLEVLSFVKSMIRHLPIEIGELSKLKLLDLSDCHELITIPPSVLSKLSQLEGLHMGNSFDGWGSSEEGVTSANVSELKQLTSLTSLDIGIRDARPISACREIFSNKKLYTYRIYIGDLSWNHGGNKISKALKLKFMDDTNDVGMEELGVMELLKESEEVCFDGLKGKGVKDFIGELDKDRSGFPKLMHLHLHKSPEIQCILDHSKSEVAVDPFPMLEDLVLEELDSLKNICCQGGLMKTQHFRKLKFIKVSRCTKLKYLFPFSVAQGLSQLLEIKVEECGEIEEIVAEEEASVNRSGACTNKNIVFSQLQSLSLAFLPKFKSFCSKEKLEILFPNLKELFLEFITWEVLWLDQLQLPTIGISFQKLIELRVTRLFRLKYLFPATLVKCLGGLKKLEIVYCESMEEVVLVVGQTEEQIVFPSLKELSMWWCPALKSFTSDSCEEETLEDENAKQRRPLFDETVAFPNLIRLNISYLDIDKIWHRQLTLDSFCKLRELEIFGCHKLRNIFSSNLVEMGRFQNLEKLEISECDSMEDVVLVVERTEEPIVFPSLKELFIRDCHALKSFTRSSYEEETLEDENAKQRRPLFDETLEIRGIGDIDKIWYRQLAPDSFCKLRELRIYSCNKLRNIFSSNLVEMGTFQNLEKLEIKFCDSMEEVVLIVGRTKEQIVFSSLKELSIVWCFNLKSFTSSSCEEENLEDENAKQRRPLFDETLAFPNLIQLYIYGIDDIDEIWHRQLAPDSFCKLRKLWIDSCEKLSHIWSFCFKDPSPPAGRGTDPHDFSNLQRVTVSGCDVLENVFPRSIATHLPKLEYLCIKECAKIEEIVAKGEEINNDNAAATPCFRFPELTTVELKRVPNLRTWYSGKHTSEFPKLKVSTTVDQVVLQSNLPSLPKQLEMYDETAQPGTLNDQENPTQNENSSTAKNFENDTFFQEQKSPRATHQGETIPPSSIEQSLTISAAAVASKVISSASTSATKTSHSQPGKSLIDTETCILPQTKEENVTQNQSSSTTKDIESGTFLQAEKGPQAIDQSITVQYVPAAAAVVAPKVPSSSSATKIPHSQPVKILIDTETYMLPQTKESKPLQDQAMTSSMIENSSNIPVSLSATTSETDYLESQIFNLEQLLNPRPALSSSSEPDTHHPNQSIGDNFKSYVPIMTLMKYIVTKDLSDVATSDDAIFLLSALKTLKNCPSLTPEELAIIEIHVKNFDSLVTTYPFHKQQLGRARALKSSSMEDDKKGILDLEMEYEEVASEANTLCAEKEALKKRLLEIEDREGKVLEKKGKLETRTNALKEAARLQNEVEDRINNANHQWVKMRSLFP